MRNRNRWMYHFTGLPGWMRYGFSPGWSGRSPWGLGPCALYLMHGFWPTPYDPWGGSHLTKEEELNILKAEAELIEDELFSIDQRIKELEGEKK